MGLGSSLKKVTKSVKKTWKKTFGWADDKETIAIGSAVALGALTGGIGWGAAGLGGIAGLSAGATGAIAGGAAGALTGLTQAQAMQAQEKAQKAQLAAMQDIANRQAAAAAVPVATSTAAQQTVSADTADTNYATERRRAMSMADTRTSQRLQRWAKNGKRRTL